MFNLVIRPNPVLAPRSVYEAKTLRWRRQWPELELGAAQLLRASTPGRDGPGLWALDLVVQPNGNWTFLELDAGGLFGFIDDGAGAPLTAQLADLLTKGKQ